MAAETSTDAYIPVSLALMKLTALFMVEYFKEVGCVVILGHVCYKPSLPTSFANLEKLLTLQSLL